MGGGGGPKKEKIVGTAQLFGGVGPRGKKQG